ncbi:MAG: N-acetylmuramoyl-L-alanine amidase-like domain-containing protein [Longimicrobiales bacterium]
MAATAVIALCSSACNGSDEPSAEEAVEATETATDRAGAAAGPAAPPPDAQPGDRSLEQDRAIFASTIERALQEGLDTVPIGDRIVAIGRWFVGAEYVPGTLEVSPERLVVNLEQFDCVTYVESILAIARVLEQPEPTFDAFTRELRTIRYRNGVMSGYASRLHYFSEWISDNEQLGIVRNITQELGGVVLNDPIDFMSSNRAQYPALESEEVLEQISSIERSLSEPTLYYIPKDRIESVAPRIRNGDVIAATSSIRGLDIAHTGFAIWIDGRLHFMNAPLVGRSVEISELPLADRIRRISGQDGIMVVRPL